MEPPSQEAVLLVVGRDNLQMLWAGDGSAEVLRGLKHVLTGPLWKKLAAKEPFDPQILIERRLSSNTSTGTGHATEVRFVGVAGRIFYFRSRFRVELQNAMK